MLLAAARATIDSICADTVLENRGDHWVGIERIRAEENSLEIERLGDACLPYIVSYRENAF